MLAVFRGVLMDPDGDGGVLVKVPLESRLEVEWWLRSFEATGDLELDRPRLRLIDGGRA
jgi:hypothetical protein